MFDVEEPKVEHLGEFWGFIVKANNGLYWLVSIEEKEAIERERGRAGEKEINSIISCLYDFPKFITDLYTRKSLV
jgi:hypothetical protein